MKSQIRNLKKTIILGIIFTLATISCAILIKHIYGYIGVSTLLIGIPTIPLVLGVLFDLGLVSRRKYKRGKCIFELFSLGRKTEALKIIPLILLILCALNIMGTKSYIKSILTVATLFMAFFLANRLWMKTICICEEGLYFFGEFYKWNNIVCYKTNDKNNLILQVEYKMSTHYLEFECKNREKEKIFCYISEKGIKQE